jgi:hypothetical protein
MTIDLTIDCQSTSNSFLPLLSPLISIGILAIAYLNWRVRTVRLRFCKSCQWRDTAVNPEGTVKITISLENYGDEGFKVLRISRLHFRIDGEALPNPEVLELEMECYGKETFNVYSIPLIPDGTTTYVVAVNVVYKSLEGFLGSDRLPFGVKSKLFLFECSPGCLPQARSFENQDQPFLSEIFEKSKRRSVVDMLPQGFS